jgi:hypothetical protein
MHYSIRFLTILVKFVRDKNDRERFRKCIATILADVVIDLNSEIEAQGDNFYYRDRLRDSRWVSDISRRVVADYSRLVTRGRISSFSDEWREPPIQMQRDK